MADSKKTRIDFSRGHDASKVPSMAPKIKTKIPFEFCSDGNTGEIQLLIPLATKDEKQAKIRGRGFIALLEAVVNADPAELQLFLSLKNPRDLIPR